MTGPAYQMQDIRHKLGYMLSCQTGRKISKNDTRAWMCN